MKRIDTPNAALNLFGAGKNGYRDGNKAAGINPTELSAAIMNGLQEELAAIPESVGMVLDSANNHQVLEAIQRMIDAQSGNYALDTGAANAYVIALNPAIAAYPDGLTVRFKIANGNTGASTLNAGAGPAPLVNDAGGALVQGDAPAGNIATATYIAAAGKFYLTSMVQSQFKSQPHTIQKFTSGSGTYTTPAGCVAIKVRMVGGGSGGSGSGEANSGGSGGAGGTTTFGTALLTATGASASSLGYSNGSAGVATIGVGISGIALKGATGGAASQGAAGGVSQYSSGGSGGSSPFGGAGGSLIVGAGYSAEPNSGSGGGGASISTGVANSPSGCGGASGGYIEALITNPNPTYPYSIGAGGTPGSIGIHGSAGGAGGSGLIIVEEYYV